MTCQNSGNISKEYKLPPKNTIGVITNDGTIDICSKSLLINPIKKPNKAKVKETKINRKIIKKGNWTSTSTKNRDVQNITNPTINVFVAPALTNAKTISNVEIGAAKISYIVPLNLGKKIPKDVLLIDWVSKVNIRRPGTI
tara:strand:- start:7 stop:429 length:423 start_codon:yes stop_codon:yes gene_type:complete